MNIGVMKKRLNVVCIRFDDDKINRMDKLVEDDNFDSRSSFIRRAVVEYLKEVEPKIEF